MKDESHITRLPEMPMEEHHLVAERCADKLTGRIRHSLRSAFHHLRRSWILHPIDPEMSLFRAITAEEEAASALMLALKQRDYPGAGLLKPRDHRHKSAITPFLQAVNNMLAASEVPTPKLSISVGETPRLRLSLDIGVLLGADPLHAEPDNPLNFVLRGGPDGSVYRFVSELREIADGKSAKDIAALVEQEANLRNRLLYAGDRGYPVAEFPDRTILERRDRVYRMTLLTIAVMQTAQHQLFATQCLSAYLSMLGKIAPDFDPPGAAMPSAGMHVGISQGEDGRYKLAAAGRSAETIVGAYLSEVYAVEADEVRFQAPIEEPPASG